jgi:hypothetical protein
MKKNNKLSLTETINAMGAANGTSILPDGKGEVLPAAIDFSAANKMRSQVPTIAAAMSSSSPMLSSGSNTQPVEEEESEEEEEMETEPAEVEEAFKIKFRNAVGSLLGEQNASPELVSQLEAVFEAAVREKVEKHVTAILEDADQTVKTHLTDITNNLVEKVDDYLEYVVEEWMSENAIAVEQGVKTQIAENFITGLKNLFENHYIDVPSEKYNVLDELYAQNKELQEQLNKSIEANINLKKEVSLTECAGIFVAETKDLADTQIVKLQSLMENVSFGTPEEYRNKLLAIKENYMNAARPVAPARVITEEQTFSKVTQAPTTLVEGYVNALGRLHKKI